MVLLCVIPCLDETISHRVRGSLVGTKVIEVEPSPSKGVLDVVHDGALDTPLVRSNVGFHHGPYFLLTLGSILAEFGSEEFFICVVLGIFLHEITRILSLDAC